MRFGIDHYGWLSPCARKYRILTRVSRVILIYEHALWITCAAVLRRSRLDQFPPSSWAARCATSRRRRLRGFKHFAAATFAQTATTLLDAEAIDEEVLTV